MGNARINFQEVKSKMDDLEREISLYNRILTKARNSGDRIDEAHVLANLAAVYSTESRVLNFPQAIELYNQALKILSEIEYWEPFYRYSYALGFIYEEALKDPNRAYGIYRYAIEHGGRVLKGSAGEEYRNDIMHGYERTRRTIDMYR